MIYLNWLQFRFYFTGAFCFSCDTLCCVSDSAFMVNLTFITNTVTKCGIACEQSASLFDPTSVFYSAFIFSLTQVFAFVCFIYSLPCSDYLYRGTSIRFCSFVGNRVPTSK